MERLDTELVADILVEIDEDIGMSSWRTWIVMMRRTCFRSFRKSELGGPFKVDDVEQAQKIAQLLTHEEDTAGALMATEYVKVQEGLTALRCVAAMRTQAENVDRVHAVYVVNEDDILVGKLSLKKLLTANRTENISELYTPIQHTVLSTTRQRKWPIPCRSMTFCYPCCQCRGELLGRITLDDVVDFIREEAERDYQLAWV